MVTNKFGVYRALDCLERQSMNLSDGKVSVDLFPVKERRLVANALKTLQMRGYLKIDGRKWVRQAGHGYYINRYAVTKRWKMKKWIEKKVKRVFGEKDMNNKKKVAYEKPLFEEQPGMFFTQQILEAFNGGRFCVQCSGCHGCR